MQEHFFLKETPLFIVVGRDAHFRIRNLEGFESQTIQNSFCSLNWVIGFDFIALH